MNIYIYYSIVFSLLISCQNSPKEKLVKEISEWQGKEIKFPNEMIFTQLINDTVEYDYNQKDYKILMYIDSLGCTPCKLKFGLWDMFMREIDSLSNNNVSYIYYFANKPATELEYMFIEEGITIPVVIDVHDSLNKINKFPENNMFHCFLLDKENKVKVIGNPIYNTKIKDLYISEINK